MDLERSKHPAPDYPFVDYPGSYKNPRPVNLYSVGGWYENVYGSASSQLVTVPFGGQLTEDPYQKRVEGTLIDGSGKPAVILGQMSLTSRVLQFIKIYYEPGTNSPTDPPVNYGFSLMQVTQDPRRRVYYYEGGYELVTERGRIISENATCALTLLHSNAYAMEKAFPLRDLRGIFRQAQAIYPRSFSQS